MDVRRTLLAILFPLLLASAVACSKDEPPSIVGPTSAFLPTGSTGSSGSSGSSGLTGSPSGLPTAPPGAATGNVSSGQVALNVTGDLQTSKAITTLVSSVYSAPPGGMALVWTAGGTDATTVGIGGASFTGSQPTSPTLSLSITVQAANDIATFLSSAGECTITIGVATAKQVAGTFSCTGLEGGSGQTIDATGSFNAQG